MSNDSFMKQTLAEEIPIDWNVKTLGEMCQIQIGKTPHREKKEYWDIDKKSRNKWVSIADMSGNKIINDTEEYISDKAISETGIKLVPKGTLLMSFKLTVGRMSIAGEDLYTNEAIAALLLDQSNMDLRDFLYYAVEYSDPASFCDPAVKGKTLNQPKIRAIPILIPAKVEERTKIASALSSIDSAIAETDAVIERASKLKKGLMQELLTRGIGHTKFKQTETGEIPEEWELIPLRDACLKTDSVNPENLNEFRYIDVSAVSNERFAITQTELLDGKTAPGRARKKVYSGDVILATIRPNLNRVALVPAELNEQICSTAFCVIRANPLKASNLFLFFLVKSEEFNSKIVKYQVGAAYPAVSDKIVLHEKIALPPKAEQEKIGLILWSAHTKIQSEVERRAQLERLKKGLMQDLLTGRVRFPEFVRSG